MQIFDGVEKRIESAATNGDTLPARGKSGEGALLDGFDFTAKASEAFAANLLKNFRVAPFLMLATSGGIRLRGVLLRPWSARRAVSTAAG